MVRPAATIIIPVWNAWGVTQACLESLRPTIGVRDEVVVVDNGSGDATPARLKSYPWVEVVTNPANRGFAAACNQGARKASREHLVFLNNDTVLAGHWLDSLLAPFEDASIGAVGPRSNFVSGPQIVYGAAYVPTDTVAMREFARDWSHKHRNEISDASRLVGFCLAVRSSAFSAVGGFDEDFEVGGFEDDDLCRKLVVAGWRLVIAHGSFVHHEGHRTFDANSLDWYAQQLVNSERFLAKCAGVPASSGDALVSACMVVRDEEDELPGCLESLAGFADEVIVYDTGSRDATMGLASDAGAKVITGSWEDDFSKARNAALSYCTGRWILWVDADERVVCKDRELVRALLCQPQAPEAFSISIDNLTGVGITAGFTHVAHRLFMRVAGEWVGRLHEEVRARSDHSFLANRHLPELRILHRGYLDEVVRVRSKAERNLQLASVEVGEEPRGADKGFLALNLGRSLLLAGRMEEGLEQCVKAALETANPVVRRFALRVAVDTALALGRLDDAEAALSQLYECSQTPMSADILAGRLYMARGEDLRAVDVFERLSERRQDEDGFEYGPESVAGFKAEALVNLGLLSQAADCLLAILSSNGTLDSHLANLVHCLIQSGRSLTEVAEALPSEHLKMFAAQLLQLDPPSASLTLAACLETRPHDPTLLAAAASIAAKLPIEDALRWSVLLREEGLGFSCPLIAVASDSSVDAISRIRYAAVAYRSFADERASSQALEAARYLDEASATRVRVELGMLAPDLLAVVDPVIASEVSDGARPVLKEHPVLAEPEGGLTASQGPPVCEREQASAAEWSSSMVSIVIPVHNRAELTLQCLTSLASTLAEELAFEVIVVDNGSTDSTADVLANVSGDITVLRNSENLGFGRACNQGAAASNGEFIVFLNNDTVLTPGWLQPLLEDMCSDPLLAAVQPKLIYPDGRLADAGGLVFANGDAWVYGRGHAFAHAPQFCCARSPDYASGACLMVRGSAFRAVGGFDDRYAPAYYEDTDLSFALESEGWKLLYDPRSVVVHIEGGTAGVDVNQGLKRYQVRNKAQFAEKWFAELLDRPAMDSADIEQWAHRPRGGFGPGEASRIPAPGLPERAAGDSPGSRSVLMVVPSVPAFDRDSGDHRCFNLLKCLRAAGHEVVLYAGGGGDMHHVAELGRYGITCYGVDPVGPGLTRVDADARGPVFKPSLFELCQQRDFDAVIITPWTVAEATMSIFRYALPDAEVIVDTNDLEYLRATREADLHDDPVARLQATQFKVRELACYARADRVICVSKPDADQLLRDRPGIEVAVVSNAHESVDPGPRFEDRSGVCFVANFLHPPNQDALEWWCKDIAPLLVSELAERLVVVGNDPRGWAASHASDAVEVIGWVPSTLPWLAAARVSVAPLRYGAGMKGKVGEAMAAGLPVVGTPIAFEGIDVVDGRDALIAETPPEIVDAVVRLHSDPELWERLSVNGRAFISENLSVDNMQRAVNSLWNPATAARRQLAGVRNS
ncbi:MAG: glycosyltransferase [Actinomycetota bacterium]|nr:glycosyltransferase [Actinomycetota bacterium]